MSSAEQTQAPAESDDLLWRHLKSVPAFRALLRAVEARFYRQLNIPDPILDLGCGDGHFARMAFGHPLAVGADPWWGPLNKARRAGVYRLNVQAMGDALPFANEAFASVISNSVLEHIPDVQPVLDEAARVLRPGGALVITVPSHLFTEYLGGAALLRPLGLADSYRRFFNRISRHAHTDPPQLWAGRLAQAGFSVERWQYYFSKDALHALELGHVQGAPSAILHFLTGHWILAPWRDNLRYTERWLRPYYEEETVETGAYLFMMARKMHPEAISAALDEVRLPAPRPLPIAEPDRDFKPGFEESDGEIALDAVREGETIVEFDAQQRSAARTGAEPGSEHGGRGLTAAILLLAGLFMALMGQSILSQRAPSTWSGLTWYAFAFIAFAGSAALLRRRRKPERGQVALSRRLLLYPAAFVLALLTQEQSGASLFGGNPLIAFILWLAAIAAAFVSLSASPGPVDDDAESSLEVPAAGEAATDPASPRTVLLLTVAVFLLALIPRLYWLTSHPFVLNGIEASIGLDAVGVLQGQIRNPFATAWLTNPTLPLYPLGGSLALFGRTVLGIRLLSAVVGALTVPIMFLIARRLWGVWFALGAALMLAGYHLHIHYSRLAMTNVWDPLVALVAIGLIGVAGVYPSRRNWLWAGLAAGLGAYFYTPSHLLPFVLAGLTIYMVVFHRAYVVQYWRHLLAGAALALVVALPQILFYRANPGLFMERANSLGIFQTSWLVEQAAAQGSVAAVLVDQLRRALLAFNGSLDTSATYNPGIPLLRFWPAIFFTLGTGVALWRLRQIRYALLLIWLGVTLFFAGALLIDAPDSHRLLIAAPAVVLLTTTGLFWLVRQAYGALSTLSAPSFPAPNARRPHVWILVVLATVFLFVAGDLFFYFGEYRNSYRFGDRNTEVAYEMGLYLDSLEGNWQAYFHGPPAMYVTFPTILFLAEDFRPGQNLFDVADPGQPAPEPGADANLVFIYLPERSAEVNVTAERYPDGSFITFDGVLANPLFYAYEVRQ